MASRLSGFFLWVALTILRAGEDNVAGEFQDVIDRNPILPSGFHAHILAVILRKPGGTPS